MQFGKIHLFGFICLTLSLISFSAASQQKVFIGTVKDSQSEEPVPFASISFIGTTMGKLTDSSGAFTFYLDRWPSDTLVITSVGYQPFRFSIDISQDSIVADIILERGKFNEGV